MPTFGVLIIRNPGPDTEVEIMGATGYHDEETDTFEKCQVMVDEANAHGDTATIITVFNSDEAGGCAQIALGYTIEEARENGCLDDEEAP